MGFAVDRYLPLSATLITLKVMHLAKKLYNFCSLTAVNQISVFNGKPACYRTNLHDATTTTVTPKNIYSPVQ